MGPTKSGECVRNIEWIECFFLFWQVDRKCETHIEILFLEPLDYQKPNQQALLFVVDSMGTQSELFGNARGRRGNRNAKQRLVGGETQMQPGRNHSD